MFSKKKSIDLTPLKQKAAEAALSYIEYDIILGIGTGSTVRCFIDLLPSVKGKIKQIISSSEQSTTQLKALGFTVTELNDVDYIDLYIDGADEVTEHKTMIKGGGGALTREKILASAAHKFICIADETKKVDVLGKLPVAVEVLPMARSFVARELVKFGGMPEYREGFITDSGNVILDVHHLDLMNPIEMETKINQIPGVVCNGIFAQRPADQVIIATQDDMMIS